jgi:hypothetical protein
MTPKASPLPVDRLDENSQITRLASNYYPPKASSYQQVIHNQKVQVSFYEGHFNIILRETKVLIYS